MAISTIYNVITRYRVEDDATSKFDRIAGAADAVGQRIDAAQNRVRSFFGMMGTVAAGAATAGLVLGARRMYQLGKAAEEARISIAGTMATLSQETMEFSGHLENADDLFSRFADRSITSPATREEFIEIFQNAAPATVPLGIDNERMSQFVQRSVGAAVAFNNNDFEQTGRDISMMLQGRAGTDVKTFANLRGQLLAKTGADSTEAFNKLAQSNPAAVFEAIESSLSKLDPALKEYANSTSGLMASANEMFNRSLLTVYKGIAEGARPQLERFINFMKDNEADVRRFAERVGGVLASGVEVLGDGLAWAATNADKLGAALSAYGTLKGLGFMRDLALAGGGGIARTLMSTHGITQSIMGMSLGGAGAAGSAASGAARTGENVMRLSTVGSGAAGMLGAGGAAAGAGGAGFAALIPTLAIGIPVLLTLFAGMAVGVLALVGAYRELMKTNSKVRDRLFSTLGEFMQSLDTLAQKMGHKDIFGLFFDAADFLGEHLLRMTANAIESLTYLMEQLQNFVTGVKVVGATIAVIQTRLQNNPASILEGGFLRSSTHQARQLVASMERGQGVGSVGRGKELADKIKKTVENRANSTGDEERNGSPSVTINNNIKQEIQSQASPSRIALRSADVVGRKTRTAIKPFAKGL